MYTDSDLVLEFKINFGEIKTGINNINNSGYFLNNNDMDESGKEKRHFKDGNDNIDRVLRKYGVITDQPEV